jgi:hypothetical protein
LPKIKIPPDKDRESEVSQKSSKEDETREFSKAETVYQRPSNHDSKISASNLRTEVSGKYLYSSTKSKLTGSHSKEQSKKKRKVSKDLEEKQESTKEGNTLPPRSEKVIKRPHLKDPCPMSLPRIKDPFIASIQRLLFTSNRLSKPLINFDISPEAAEENFRKFKQANFNLDLLLNSPSSTSVTSYGSEFKSVKELYPLLGKHHRWKELKTKLIKGSSWPMMKQDEFSRKKDLEGAIKRGNHKSAGVNQKFLSDALSKEIKKGWEMILPLNKANEIPNLFLSPLGVAKQIGINAAGEFVKKWRVTHDLSFPGIHSNQSVNSMVIEEDLEPCMFGHTLLRIIHRIVHLRSIHPEKIIWI